MFKRLKEIYAYRNLLWLLVRKEMKLKYHGSILGFVWSVMKPLFLMMVYYFVFDKILGRSTPPYAILTGLLPWMMFISSNTASANSILKSFNIMNQIRFPYEILPLSKIFSNVINFAISLVVLLTLYAIYKVPFQAYMLYFPILLLIELTLIIGLSLILCSITIFIRDITIILDVIFKAWFFLTPVIYSYSLVTDRSGPLLQKLYLLNPMTPIVVSMKFVMGVDPNFGILPPMWGHLMYSLGLGIILIIIGYILFSKLRNKFIKLI
ncbi:ABC transporter permease [Candidatus Dependentiae bacterium]|nr:ABC transporter permease [Candidatus Dependentiae bacterium]